MDGHSTRRHPGSLVVALYPGGARPGVRVATGAPVIHCRVCWILLPDDSTGACVPAPDDAEQSWEYGNATCVARRGERWERLGGRTKPGAHVKRLSPDVLARREAIRARVAQLTAEGYSVRRMVRALRDEGYRLLHGSPSHEMVERMRREVRR